MSFKVIGEDGLPDGVDARLVSLLVYWRQKRSGRRFPSRKDLDPIDIPRLLPFLTLVDVVPDPHCFVYRLVGTAAAGILRRDLTGAPVGHGLIDQELDEVMGRYRYVRDAGVVLYQSVQTQEHANDYTLVDRLMTPLGDDGEVSKILSMIVPVGGPANASERDSFLLSD